MLNSKHHKFFQKHYIVYILIEFGTITFTVLKAATQISVTCVKSFLYEFKWIFMVLIISINLRILSLLETDPSIIKKMESVIVIEVFLKR